MIDVPVQSEELFRILAENCPAMIFLEVDNRIVYVNSHSIFVSGYTPDEILADGFDFSKIFYQKPVSQLKQEFTQAIADSSEKTSQKEVEILRKDGQVRSCILSVQNMVHQGKKAYLCIINDVTDLNLANRRLLESRQRYWSLFEGASDAIFLETIDGVILDCNVSAVRSYGYTREELMGMNASELVPGEHSASLQAIEDELGRSDYSGKTITVVSTGKRKSGQIFPAEVSITPLTLDGDNVYLVNVRDISIRRDLEVSRKRYEQQLNQLKLLDNFSNVVHGLANDFNNLLTGIMGYADLILRDLSPASPAREKARKIVEASRKGGEFIQQLISTTGRLPTNFQSADINVVIKEMIPDLSAMVSSKGVLTCVFDDQVPELLFDAGQIKVAVKNLVLNAFDASIGPDGKFALSIHKGDQDYSGAESGYFGPPLSAGTYVSIRVADNGSGIESCNLSRIFEPFFSTRFSQRGLGLATVLGIVRRHRGAIMVKSQVNMGSEFFLLLPIQTDCSAAHSQQNTQGDKAFPAGAILVVDDDAAVCEILCSQLKVLGFETFVAHNGVDGLEQFKQINRSLSLVFLDLAMPEKSGLELLHEMRWLNPKIPVIICTGMHDFQEDLSQLGVSTILHKPFRLKDIEQALLRVQLKS